MAVRSIRKYIVEATGSGVAIVDYDGDGWPDIFLVNGTGLSKTGKATGAPASNHLLRNNHDGTFTDVTAKAGLVSSGWGQGACVGDYDNDGFDDIYVTGYGKGRLFHNLGNGTFKEVGESCGGGGEWQGMGDGVCVRRLRPGWEAGPDGGDVCALRTGEDAGAGG